MMRSEIIFNGVRTWQDLGLTIKSKNIGFPAKKKVLQEVPYSNDVIDLSNLYGAPVYTDRTLTYEFNVADRVRYDRKLMSMIKTRVVNRFMQIGERRKLIDPNELADYYYMAELQEAPDFDEFMGMGRLVLKFRAYPFKRSNYQEGSDLWDPFNFELDVFQDVRYAVNGSTEITLYNNGVTFSTPVVRISGPVSKASPIQVMHSGYTYTFESPGDYANADFYLPVGESVMTVTGNGTIEFIWHKELI